MSHYMTALAMKQQGLKPAAKIVLYWLADHHNGETGQCNPSINRLAKCCEMSRRSVENHLQTLQDAGLIKITNRHREQGGKTSNTYRLCLVESDAQNLRMGSAKSAHGDAQNLRMKNLGTFNLGNERIKDVKNEASFDDFWAVVPRKENKGGSRRAWEKAIKKASPQLIINAMQAYAKRVKDSETEACWIKHPSGWLNDERWDDEPEQKSTEPKGGQVMNTPQGWKEYVDGVGWCRLHPEQVKEMGLGNE